MTINDRAGTSNANPYPVWSQFVNGAARAQRSLHAHSFLSPLIVLISAYVIFGLISGRMFAPQTISIMVQQVAVIGLLALGQTLIILTAGIDLAVGAAMILSQMVMAGIVVNSGFPAWLGIIVGMIVALATGLLDGTLVTKMHVPPFIGTLGTLGVFTAIGLLYANGQTVVPHDGSLLLWSGRPIAIGPFTITTGVLILVLLYAIFAYNLKGTSWGKHVYAVGDSPEAARLSGLRVSRVLLSVYIAAGAIYGIAAWVEIGRTGNASTNISPTLNLDSITAAIIGGVSLFGGRGVVVGALLGALIVEVFQTGLALVGVQSLYQQLAEGLLVIGAVGLDQWVRRVRA